MVSGTGKICISYFFHLNFACVSFPGPKLLNETIQVNYLLFSNFLLKTP